VSLDWVLRLRRCRSPRNRSRVDNDFDDAFAKLVKVSIFSTFAQDGVLPVAWLDAIEGIGVAQIRRKGLAPVLGLKTVARGIPREVGRDSVVGFADKRELRCKTALVGIE